MADLVTRLLLVRHGEAHSMFVTHGGFITSVCLHLLQAGGLHERRPFWLDPAPTSITEGQRPNHADQWELVRYNDVGHLE